MSYGRLHAILVAALAGTLLIPPAGGQSVISTHSGVVHFFEGSVYVDEQPLQSHPGRFSTVPQGAVLRTADGRAEVLLTPGVFIRIGERSAVRLITNALSNTRVELLAGSAIVDTAEPTPDTSVTLVYKSWSIRSRGQGAYRIDCDPPRLWVLNGEAEVSAGNSEAAVLVKRGMDVPFGPVLVPEGSIAQPDDALSSWAEGRQESISADNAIAANIQDPAAITTTNPGYGGFTQFPMLGLSSLGPGWSTPYDALVIYQPGFNSIYLPGYNYPPFLVGVYAGGFSTFGVLPRLGLRPVLPRHPVLPTRPWSPVSSGPTHLPSYSSHPASPAHFGSPGLAGGAHVGAHR